MKISSNAAAVLKATLLVSTGIIASGVAQAQDKPAANDSGGIEEIIVTAQKREQNLQDVPIAVSALGVDTLKANGVTNVTDISGLVPNVLVQHTVGGANAPTFTIRGVLGQGTSAGTDRSVGLYLDGVALGTGLGTSFDVYGVLKRVEVLRGPQGTLFGRNATAGAVSFVTMDPDGKAGGHIEAMYGNFGQIRGLVRLSTPQIGPFSAYINFTHDERNGDIKNTGAGTVWDWSAFGFGKRVSPKTLGGKNVNAVFAALKFDATDNFYMVYKFDHVKNDFVPEGVGLAAWNSAAASNTFGGFLPNVDTPFNAAIAAGRLALSGYTRPDAVNNEYTVPGLQKITGHNLTAYLDLSDSITIKNVFGARKGYNLSFNQVDGAGGLRDTAGNPIVLIGGSNLGTSRQLSDELQVNINTKLTTITAGAIYFHQKTRMGGPVGWVSSTFRRVIPGYTIVPSATTAGWGESTTDSYAAYAQAEMHVLPNLDIVGGARLTRDEKSGVNHNGTVNAAYTYAKTKATYLANVNWKPTSDIMVYAKFSTGYVSGGSVGSLQFEPETATSWEAGLKSELFDRRARFNLALFDTTYKNLQGLTLGRNVGLAYANLGQVVVALGELHAQGFEAEVTVVPADGLSLSGNFGYTHFKLNKPNPVIGGANYTLPFRPDATGALSAQYVSQPVFDDTNVMIRLDGNWHSKIRQLNRLPYPASFVPYTFSQAGWVVNGRIALQHVKIGGAETELALFGKNLFDSKRAIWGTPYGDGLSTLYEPARTYGVELSVDF